MARTWLSVQVELVHGRGQDFWSRPGRVFAAARSHTFGQLSRAIDIAFARWDLAHMHMFTFADGTEVSELDHWDGEEPEGMLGSSTKLSRLQPGDQFAYVFDFGDDWSHLCTVGTEKIDPANKLGIVPDEPLPYWGWGELPDQYGRRWADDDGSSRVPEGTQQPVARPAAAAALVGPRRR
ncbi:hypothetical protein AB0A63_35385 [Lentzea sp. NPDC042327]|uniref:IS1096 element passenger TnpR family protein n=1 Tax=Lentzea sp. NPDC042327 TaxID=3154801 RepID=UPI0033E0874A